MNINYSNVAMHSPAHFDTVQLCISTQEKPFKKKKAGEVFAVPVMSRDTVSSDFVWIERVTFI